MAVLVDPTRNRFFSRRNAKPVYISGGCSFVQSNIKVYNEWLQRCLKRFRPRTNCTALIRRTAERMTSVADIWPGIDVGLCVGARLTGGCYSYIIVTGTITVAIRCTHEYRRIRPTRQRQRAPTRHGRPGALLVSFTRKTCTA